MRPGQRGVHGHTLVGRDAPRDGVMHVAEAEAEAAETEAEE